MVIATRNRDPSYVYAPHSPGPAPQCRSKHRRPNPPLPLPISSYINNKKSQTRKTPEMSSGVYPIVFLPLNLISQSTNASHNAERRNPPSTPPSHLSQKEKKESPSPPLLRWHRELPTHQVARVQPPLHIRPCDCQLSLSITSPSSRTSPSLFLFPFSLLLNVPEHPLPA